MEDARRSLIHIHQAYKTPEKVHLGFFDRTGENKPCLSTRVTSLRAKPAARGGRITPSPSPSAFSLAFILRKNGDDNELYLGQLCDEL